MNDPEHQNNAESFASRQHASLHKVLDDAEKVLGHRMIGTFEVASMISELCSEIEGHFNLEEEGGLFERIIEKAPSLKDCVSTLLSEHASMRELLRELKLASLAGDGSDSWWERLDGLFQQIRTALLEHEEKEIKLLQDTYMQDIGSMD